MANTNVPTWSRSYVYVLEGTHLELHPQYRLNCWYVVDVSGANEVVLSPALPLTQAKRRAERIAATKKDQ